MVLFKSKSQVETSLHEVEAIKVSIDKLIDEVNFNFPPNLFHLSLVFQDLFNGCLRGELRAYGGDYGIE